MKTIKATILTLVYLQLVACGSAVYTVKTTPSADDCPVHVLRQSFALVYSMNILVDGETYAKLSDYTYAKFPVNPGKHTIKASWPFLSGGVDLDVPYECKKAQPAYIVFNGSYSGFRRYIKAKRITEREAMTILGKYKLAGAE